jgi:sugar phosphate isomerase/epimerase
LRRTSQPTARSSFEAMKIGAMNHPGEPLQQEIAWMRDLQLDFIDLTLEPPEGATWKINAREVKKMISDAGLEVVGHTAYYLPIGSSFESLRRAAIDELKRALDAFAEIGARWMNVHPDGHAPFTPESVVVGRNIESLRELCEYGKRLKVGVMVENVPGRFNNVAQLQPVFDGAPDAALHLDIGHSNLMVESNTAGELISRFATKLAHVHLHDNRGGHADLHLALGMGNIDFPLHVKQLRAAGFDGTITLEVFARDRHYFQYSREVLRKLWDETGAAK